MSDDEPTFTLTLSQLVRFAQEGWHYPLTDDDDTREEVGRVVGEILSGERQWLDEVADSPLRAFSDVFEMTRSEIPLTEALKKARATQAAWTKYVRESGGQE